MDDNESQLFQNSIRYLHNVSTLTEMNVPALKSFLCLKRRLMELRRKTFLPLGSTKPNLHCQKCFLNFFDGPASYNVKSKLKKHKFAKKLLNKQKNGEYLTKYQEEYLKRNNKFNGNHLVITCKFCKFETNLKLNRPPIKKMKSIQPSMKKKKKKPKKDKFCGLDQNVVKSVSLNKSKTMDDSDVIYLNSWTPSLTKQKNKRNKNDSISGLNQSVISVSTIKSRNISESEVICLDSDESGTPVKNKMKKKVKPLEMSTPKTPLSTTSLLISKKKNKARGKLAEILKNSSKKKKSNSSNLMHFLQSL